uniref:Uncharacterized protein n=1 Tax=Trichogramma kaykai TaxID=54128 RepID=A0ABD2WB66_9HYME
MRRGPAVAATAAAATGSIRSSGNCARCCCCCCVSILFASRFAGILASTTAALLVCSPVCIGCRLCALQANRRDCSVHGVPNSSSYARLLRCVGIHILCAFGLQSATSFDRLINSFTLNCANANDNSASRYYMYHVLEERKMIETSTVNLLQSADNFPDDQKNISLKLHRSARAQHHVGPKRNASAQHKCLKKLRPAHYLLLENITHTHTHTRSSTHGLWEKSRITLSAVYDTPCLSPGAHTTEH